MVETLYKTKVPQTTDWRDQFFELSMGEQKVDGQRGFFVRETQCWWDASAQRTIRVQYTLSPREGFMTLAEADACYQSRKISRARRGFVHSYAPRYESTRKNRYVLIQIPAEAKTEELNSQDLQS
jgi:hypothetical protein